jgi:hypothetical protein
MMISRWVVEWALCADSRPLGADVAEHVLLELVIALKG